MKMKMNRKEAKEILLIISSFLIGGLVMLIFTTLLNRPQIVQNKTKIYEKNSLGNSIEKVQDAVVTIETFNGTTPLSTGTGFIYKVDRKAYILTNEHVIDGNVVKVILSDDHEVDAKVLGKDALLDLAVLEIDKKYVKQVATLGDSNKVNVGDTIFVVGSPLSKRYQGSVTAGILSGKNRIVQTMLEEEDKESEWLMNVMQVDASINPGNSGSPLLNTNGEVIGVVVLKLIRQDVEGMAFAIPMDYVYANIDNLEKGKELTWPELGISMTDANNTSELIRQGLEVNDLTRGVVVLSVKKGSSADNRLQKGDIILKMDDVEIKDNSYVKYILFQHKVGDKIKMKIIRNKKEKEIEVVLKESSK